jgi:hypothetical protein
MIHENAHYREKRYSKLLNRSEVVCTVQATLRRKHDIPSTKSGRVSLALAEGNESVQESVRFLDTDTASVRKKRNKLLYDQRANTDSHCVGTENGIRVVGTKEQLHSRNAQTSHDELDLQATRAHGRVRVSRSNELFGHIAAEVQLHANSRLSFAACEQ